MRAKVGTIDLFALSHTHVELNSFQGGAFASLSYPHFFMNAALTYGLNKVDMRRPCVIDTIYCSPDGNTFTAPERQAIRSALPLCARG
jgi:hypothetical protein